MNQPRTFSRAVYIGAAAFFLAALFLFVHPLFSAAILAGFVAVCLAAPFFPGAGIFLPVIRRGRSDAGAVAITFDDGPNPQTTPVLLKMLACRSLTAAFFVVGRYAEKHPDLVREILRAGHCIGNHTYRHDVFVMLKSAKTLGQEIDTAQEVFSRFGIRPLSFRPPAGVVNPRLEGELRKRGMVCIHYSCRGPDMGNRRIRGLSGKILKKIQSGDIVLLHDACPDSRYFTVDQWIDEIGKILDGISEKGLAVMPLDELIGRPVMDRHEGAGIRNKRSFIRRQQGGFY